VGLNPGARGVSYLGKTVMTSSRDDLVVGGALPSSPLCLAVARVAKLPIVSFIVPESACAQQQGRPQGDKEQGEKCKTQE
jgi:hypothetical protein